MYRDAFANCITIAFSEVVKVLSHSTLNGLLPHVISGLNFFFFLFFTLNSWMLMLCSFYAVTMSSEKWEENVIALYCTQWMCVQVWPAFYFSLFAISSCVFWTQTTLIICKSPSNWILLMLLTLFLRDATTL